MATIAFGFRTLNSFKKRNKLQLDELQVFKNAVVANGILSTTTAASDSGSSLTGLSASPSGGAFLRKSGSSFLKIPAPSVADEYINSTESRFYHTAGGASSGTANLYGAFYTNDGTNHYSMGLIPPHKDVTLAQASSGSVADGDYKYVYTYVDKFGNESPPSAETSAVTVSGGPKKISHTNIPIGPAQVVARNLYRMNVNVTSAYQFVTQIPDNTTTTFDDKLANASLGDEIQTSGFDIISHAQLKPFQSADISVASAGAGSITGIVHYVVVTAKDFIAGGSSAGPDSIYEQWSLSNTIMFNAAAGLNATITIANYNSALNYYLYRLDESTSSRIWRKVGAFSGSTYSDTTSIATLASTNAYYGGANDSRDFSLLAGPHHGMLFGAFRNTVSWSKQGNFLLWKPTEYFQKFNGVVKALIPFNGELIVLTDQGISRLIGDIESNLIRVDVPNTTGAKSSYAIGTPHGLMYFDTLGHISLWPGGDSPSVPISRDVLAPGTITAARMTYHNNAVYIAGNTTCYCIDFQGQAPAWKTYDYGLNTLNFYHDGTRLYIFNNDNTIYQLASTTAEPNNTSGAGPAWDITTAEFTGEDAQAYKYFNKIFIKYACDNTVTLKMYRDGSLIKTYSITTSSSAITRKVIKIPSGHGYGIYFQLTTSSGTTADVYDFHIEWDELKK